MRRSPRSKRRSGSLASSVTSSRPSSDGWKRSEEHTSELQSPCNLVCRLLLETKNGRISHDDKQILDAELARSEKIRLHAEEISAAAAIVKVHLDTDLPLQVDRQSLFIHALLG